MPGPVRPSFAAFIALRHLRSQQQERFISLAAALAVAGIALGLAALILVISVMSGFAREMEKRLIGVGAHLVVEDRAGIPDPAVRSAELSRLDQVAAVSPFVSGQGVVRLGRQFDLVVVQGVDPAAEGRVSLLPQTLIKGRFDLSDSGLVIGRELANRYALAPGDRFQIFFPLTGRQRDFRIAGVFYTGLLAYDTALVVFDLGRAQEVFGLGGRVSGLRVRLKEPRLADRVKQELRQKLGPLPEISSWFDLNRNLIGALRIERRMMTLILTTTLLVAFFNIASVLMMIVLKKTRTIGVLRSFGADTGDIARIFLLEGLLIGLLGLAFGLVLGLAAAFNVDRLSAWLERFFGAGLFPRDIYYLDRIPVQVEPLFIALACLGCLAAALLASLYPALKAARLDPVEALRHD